MNKTIKTILYINTIFNLVGAVVLFFATGLLNGLMDMNSEANVLWHLLGACSLAFAFLAFGATRFRDELAVKTIVATLIIFNGVSAIVSVIMVVNGSNMHIIANVAMHILMLVLLGIGWIQIAKQERKN